MSRAKLSEYRAKNILEDVFNVEYAGLSVQTDNFNSEQIIEFVKKYDRCVLKVDQAIKRRNKLGLIDLDVRFDSVLVTIEKYKNDGYKWLLIEPFIAHQQSSERFLSLELVSEGVSITYSKKGGVDIESNHDTLEHFLVRGESDLLTIDDIAVNVVSSLLGEFNNNHMTNLEINPLIVDGSVTYALDAAVEVDTSAISLVDTWSLDDIRTPMTVQSKEEEMVDILASKSPASLSLKVLNKEGSIFLLLSGGGASVVVLDELSAHGKHELVANYGEYSGNPNEEETYLYASQVLKLLIESQSANKVLYIAGGVANFTDIHHTFKGVVRALSDNVDSLREQGVMVIVRRGGPNQEKGLAYLKEFLDKEFIKNEVYDSSVSLSKATIKVIEAIS